MKNFLTFKVESWLGCIFLVAFAGFFVGLFFIFMKNYNSELVLNDPSGSRVLASVRMSQAEQLGIAKWVKQNNIVIPATTKDQYRYLLNTYPDRPWLQ